jgi:hypothetical protein
MSLSRKLCGMLLAGVFLALPALAAPPPLTLLGDRFEVEATWRTADGATGFGTGVPLTDETGYFWFFSPTNTEVVVKVLDACSGPSGRFWVFAGGLTDVEVELTVTDSATGEKKTYRNPRGTPFQPVQDTGAFATCGVARCGQGTFAEIAATPRADEELETLALFMGGRIAAPQAVYDRVVADVAAIRVEGQNAEANYMSPHEPQSLILSVDADTRSQVQAGTYHAWDCLNRWYGVERIDLNTSSVVLWFRGVLDIERLQHDYKALPGITHTSTNDYLFPLLPPGTGALCGWAVDDTFYYFVRWSPPLRYYTSQPGQAPVAHGPVSGNPAVEALATQCYQEHGIG